MKTLNALTHAKRRCTAPRAIMQIVGWMCVIKKDKKRHVFSWLQLYHKDAEKPTSCGNNLKFPNFGKSNKTQTIPFSHCYTTSFAPVPQFLILTITPSLKFSENSAAALLDKGILLLIREPDEQHVMWQILLHEGHHLLDALGHWFPRKVALGAQLLDHLLLLRDARCHGDQGGDAGSETEKGRCSVREGGGCMVRWGGESVMLCFVLTIKRYQVNLLTGWYHLGRGFLLNFPSVGIQYLYIMDLIKI